MINDGEQGNAVPPFCCSLMGIEKLKKKKKKSWFLLSSESGGHPEYITAILLLPLAGAAGFAG